MFSSGSTGTNKGAIKLSGFLGGDIQIPCHIQTPSMSSLISRSPSLFRPAHSPEGFVHPDLLHILVAMSLDFPMSLNSLMAVLLSAFAIMG
jgi:hypothetical protein